MIEQNFCFFKRYFKNNIIPRFLYNKYFFKMKNIVRKSYSSTHIFLEQNISMTNDKPSHQLSTFKQLSISIFTKIISAKNSRHKIYFYISNHLKSGNCVINFLKVVL